MFFRFAKTDDVHVIASLCVSQMHDAAVEPAEQIDALLAVRFPRIFPTDDRVFEDRLATREIEIAVFDIAQAL